MSDNTHRGVLITAIGDTTCSDDAKKTFNKIVGEKPDANLFLASCFIDIFKSFNGLKEKTIFSRGNHDDKENESDTVKVELEDYFGITE